MIDARDQVMIGADSHSCSDFTNVTLALKDDSTNGVFIIDWKQFGQNENKLAMKAGKEETTCLLGVARNCSIMAFVHGPVKGKREKSLAPEPMIKDDTGRKSCLLDGWKGSVHSKSSGVSWGMKSQREFSIIQYDFYWMK